MQWRSGRVKGWREKWTRTQKTNNKINKPDNLIVIATKKYRRRDQINAGNKLANKPRRGDLAMVTRLSPPVSLYTVLQLCDLRW